MQINSDHIWTNPSSPYPYWNCGISDLLQTSNFWEATDDEKPNNCGKTIWKRDIFECFSVIFFFFCHWKPIRAIRRLKLSSAVKKVFEYEWLGARTNVNVYNVSEIRLLNYPLFKWLFHLSHIIVHTFFIFPQFDECTKQKFDIRCHDASVYRKERRKI